MPGWFSSRAFLLRAHNPTKGKVFYGASGLTFASFLAFLGVFVLLF
jgi:hypothetical protein